MCCALEAGKYPAEKLVAARGWWPAGLGCRACYGCSLFAAANEHALDILLRCAAVARSQAVHAATAPILHLRTINPYLHSALAGAAAGSRVQVPRQGLPWSASSSGGGMAGGRLVGSVSSFAFMGTNGQTIIAGPATLAGAGGLLELAGECL